MISVNRERESKTNQHRRTRRVSSSKVSSSFKFDAYDESITNIKRSLI